ncbi:ATP-dependent dsDNA exonuclease [Nitrospirillum viridazoti Y2]|uniref:Nuclease SbcCD subunit D n=1 Tax=Nitrospirillum amazonense TaxID=28077 RepID=A0A560IGD4_9PROT|nr:exonuclease SbcCD subunit D [Nitrospirillum amazonense]EGY02527.1 ATP-dependent dsDNA exonuclease [Nitrospirillum amazonense Y2]TWB56124.1 exodeoxyribonuclease I subunit D [Nitrospirillum amazonense]
MRILHTADWHIGQTLNGWTREVEHHAFLDHLADVIEEEAVDALIIAGDVFDGINPSGDAQRMLYSALAKFRQRRPHLTTVMIAGNHDPAGRLEAPDAVLQVVGVHALGTLRWKDGQVDMDRHLIPVADADEQVRAMVLAIPFLRAADLPGLTLGAEVTAGSPVVAATRAFHQKLAAQAQARAGGLPIIATGHLHCAGGTESEGVERRILIGGEHAVPPEIYDPAFAYVALGHLHRPQNLGGGRVRYSGSPFPLSAAEIGYDHGVTLVDIGEDGVMATHRPLPRPIPCLQLPERGRMSVGDLDAALTALNLDASAPKDRHPFVWLRLLADRPVPNLLAEIETVLESHAVRRAGVRIEQTARAVSEAAPPVSLAETSPEELFVSVFQDMHGMPPDARHLAAFRDAQVGE